MYNIFDLLFDFVIVRAAYLIRLNKCSVELGNMDPEELLMMERNTQDILNSSERVRTIPHRVRNIIKVRIDTN
jgi:hypothetical protein